MRRFLLLSTLGAGACVPSAVEQVSPSPQKPERCEVGTLAYAEARELLRFGFDSAIVSRTEAFRQNECFHYLGSDFVQETDSNAFLEQALSLHRRAAAGDAYEFYLPPPGKYDRPPTWNAVSIESCDSYETCPANLLGYFGEFASAVEVYLGGWSREEVLWCSEVGNWRKCAAAKAYVTVDGPETVPLLPEGWEVSIALQGTNGRTTVVEFDSSKSSETCRQVAWSLLYVPRATFEIDWPDSIVLPAGYSLGSAPQLYSVTEPAGHASTPFVEGTLKGKGVVESFSLGKSVFSPKNYSEKVPRDAGLALRIDRALARAMAADILACEFSFPG